MLALFKNPRTPRKQKALALTALLCYGLLLVWGLAWALACLWPNSLLAHALWLISGTWTTATILCFPLFFLTLCFLAIRDQRNRDRAADRILQGLCPQCGYNHQHHRHLPRMRPNHPPPEPQAPPLCQFTHAILSPYAS